MSFHNGKLFLSDCKMGPCSFAMHNGKVDGSLVAPSVAAHMHNGKITLGYTSDADGSCEVSAHNGQIDIKLERADDIGYEVEYSYFTGRGPSGDLVNCVNVLESSVPTHGAGRRHWRAATDGIEAKRRKIRVKASLHNGSIQVN